MISIEYIMVILQFAIKYNGIQTDPRLLQEVGDLA